MTFDMTVNGLSLEEAQKIAAEYIWRLCSKAGRDIPDLITIKHEGRTKKMKFSISVQDMSCWEAQKVLALLLDVGVDPNAVAIAPKEERLEAPATEPATAPATAPAEEPKEEKRVSRKDAKSAAVRRIQAGHRDEVKALVTAFTQTGKVDDIPEDKLPEFVDKLAEIGA